MTQISENPYHELFTKQKVNQFKVAQSTYNERVNKLNALHRAIEITYREQIKEALSKDLGKPVIESELSEIYQILGDIRYVKKHLHKWMRKQKVHTPLSLLGSSSYYIYEPKGVCLIISPWNFPFNLTFGPLISAIAAGNTAIIKPSEMTPNSSALMATIIKDLFNEEEVALIEGKVEVSTKLLELPFNHIFFTGSPNVGKIVMTAAAKNLASVTLELGGKSPTIIDESANIKEASKKIVWGKFLNAGQICVSPDYILVDEKVRDEFIDSCKRWIKKFYSEDPESSNAFARIVTPKHYKRLLGHLENAKSHNAKIVAGGEFDENTKFIAPTIVTDLNTDATLLNEEIFGPIMPIISYTNLDEAIAYVNSKERPLALYVYSKKKSNIKKVISGTRAGGTCINNNVIHYANHNLPFGGTNNSGIGKSHGFFGFKAFSNQRAVVKQHFFGATEFLFPPYDGFKEKMAKLVVKWF